MHQNIDQIIEVLDIPLYRFDVSRAAAHVINCCLSDPRQNRCITLTGAHGIIESTKNRDFKQLLLSTYLNLPDGMPGVWVGRLKGARQMKRCTGAKFFAEVMRQSAGTGIKHFLCGGKPGVAEELKESCHRKFGNQNIVGTHCPPFQPLDTIDFEGLADQINRSGADFVWIGISTPKQEFFARYLAGHTEVHFIATVGAVFDFYTGRLSQAPEVMQKNGLEWLYRLLMEPRRLYKRYFEIVPKFIFYAVPDLIRHRKNKNRKNTPE